MKTLLKSAIAGALGFFAFAAASAHAGNKPDDYDRDYDHRSHHANHYDYYAHDRYYRAGPYSSSGVIFSVRYGDGHYRRGHDSRHHRNKRRVVHREIFNTRYRARIVLIEEVVHRRRGTRLVCTVEARGPEARYVSKRRIHRIADRNCSPRSRIRVFA